MITEEPPYVPPLEHALVSVAAAASPSEALDRLVEGSLLLVPRVALFLVRHGRVRGWRAAGHDPETARELCQVDVPLEGTWLGRVASQTAVAVVEKLPGESLPGCGERPGAETTAIALRVGGTVVCFLVTERPPAQEAWDLGALRLLALFCQMRLELDFVRRKQTPSSEASASPNPSSASPDPVPAARMVAEPPTTSVSAQPAPTELAPVPERTPPTESSRVREARRFARLIATDIRLYNEEAVLAGRRQRDLARRLGDQIERGRESFLRRFADLGPDGLALLEEAYVEILAAGDPAALSL